MSESLRTLKGVGEKTEKLFQKIGVFDTEGLLRYYPRNYDQYEMPAKIAELKEGTVKAVSAFVCSGVYVNAVRGRQVISITAGDETEKLNIVWFNTPYLKSMLKKGARFIFRGKIIRRQGKLSMEHPEIFTPAAYEEILHKMCIRDSYMSGRIDSGLGRIVIDTDVIATYAGSVAVECFGIVGMAAVSMKDGLVKLLHKDSLKHGISVVAVSYTHLDVYKRQAQLLPISCSVMYAKG